MINDPWIFLFLLGVLLFNAPFLTIFEGALPHYLFAAWAIIIAAAGIVIARAGKKKGR